MVILCSRSTPTRAFIFLKQAMQKGLWCRVMLRFWSYSTYFLRRGPTILLWGKWASLFQKIERIHMSKRLLLSGIACLKSDYKRYEHIALEKVSSNANFGVDLLDFRDDRWTQGIELQKYLPAWLSHAWRCCVAHQEMFQKDWAKCGLLDAPEIKY